MYLRYVLQEFIKLYDAWHAAEPDKGDTQAAEWRAKLEALSATTQPATPASRPASQATPDDD